MVSRRRAPRAAGSASLRARGRGPHSTGRAVCGARGSCAQRPLAVAWSSCSHTHIPPSHVTRTSRARMPPPVPFCRSTLSSWRRAMPLPDAGRRARHPMPLRMFVSVVH